MPERNGLLQGLLRPDPADDDDWVTDDESERVESDESDGEGQQEEGEEGNDDDGAGGNEDGKCACFGAVIL